MPQVTGCTFTPPSGGSTTGTISGCSEDPNVNVGNFVLIEGTGTDLDNPWPVTGTASNGFTFRYPGTAPSMSNVVVTIPLVWLGNGAGVVNANGGVTNKNDEGVYLENLAVDCNDLPNSIGIFSATANEDSYLKSVMVRYCSRNGVYYQNYTGAGAPANFGTDRDLQIYMSDQTTPSNPAAAPMVNSITTVSSGVLQATVSPNLSSKQWLGYPVMFSSYPGVYTVVAETDGVSTSTLNFASSTISPCSPSTTACTGTVSVVPAGYHVSLGAAPFRGLEGATIRPDTAINNALDGVQLDGVLGGNVQNIHCEHLNNCVHITSKAPTSAVVIQNISAGFGSAGITGADYANEPNNGGTNIFVSGLANFGNTTTLVSDPLALPTATKISGNALSLYITGPSIPPSHGGSGGSLGKVFQSCGVITLQNPSPNPLTCNSVTADSLCTSTPNPSVTGLALTPSTNSVSVAFSSGAGQKIGISCTI